MIKVENLNVSYYGNEVIKNISFEFKAGRLIGIIGPNGAGKSTLIKGILGLIPNTKGKITINSISITKQKKYIAYVPQRNDLDWDFPINVFDTVLMGTYPHLGLFKRPKNREKKLVRDSLKRVGMLDFADKQIGELSGGQQQRVFLARALAQEADIFFLDEPFIGIDISSEEKIIGILRELKKEGKIIFIVHHDLSKVESYFDELLLINKTFIETGTVKEVFVYDTISKAYETNFNIPRSKEVI